MKFNQSNTFIATLVVYAKYVKHCLEYKSPWLYTQIVSIATWFITKATSVESATSEEYEDPWTSDLFIHLVKLSDGQELPILCESIEDAWNRIEAWLFEKGDFNTTILGITKDEW